MSIESQKIERKDSTSFESVLIEDKTEISSKPISLSDVIIREEAKIFKEQKKKEQIDKEKKGCCNNTDDSCCFSFSFWCCFFDSDCDFTC